MDYIPDEFQAVWKFMAEQHGDKRFRFKYKNLNNWNCPEGYVRLADYKGESIPFCPRTREQHWLRELREIIFFNDQLDYIAFANKRHGDIIWHREEQTHAT